MSLPLQKNLNLLIPQWKGILDPLVSNPILLGQQLSNVSLSTSSTTVKHALGRVQQGWFITDIDAAATVFRTGDFNDSNMALTASVACVVDMWVY